MRVFISWSGERSRLVAEALKEWLSDVIQSVDLWVSSEDTEKGTISMDKLNLQLKDTQFGIVCLTPENLTSPWIHFEAGAIAKAVMGDDKGRLWRYLIGLNHSDIKSPLWQFQHTLANEQETRSLLNAINNVTESPRTESKLQKHFERWWPDLQSKLESIAASTTSSEPEPRKGSQHDRRDSRAGSWSRAGSIDSA
jgi:hypothetical protein